MTWRLDNWTGKKVFEMYGKTEHTDDVRVTISREELIALFSEFPDKATLREALIDILKEKPGRRAKCDPGNQCLSCDRLGYHLVK